MTTHRGHLFVTAALLVMCSELHALRTRNSYSLPHLQPRGRQLDDFNAATGLMMAAPQPGSAAAGEETDSGRGFYKKFMLLKGMFQQPTAGNVIVITQPATPTTTTTTNPTTTTTTTTTTPTTNATSRSAAYKQRQPPTQTNVRHTPALVEEHVDDVDVDDRLDRLEVAQPDSAQAQVEVMGKLKRKPQQKQERRKSLQQRKVHGAQKQIRKLKKRHRHIKRKNASKTRQKPTQQQKLQQQIHSYNNHNTNNNNDRIENMNPNTSSRLQQMWQALRRQTAAATPVERGRSQQRRGRHRSRI